MRALRSWILQWGHGLNLLHALCSRDFQHWRHRRCRNNVKPNTIPHENITYPKKIYSNYFPTTVSRFRFLRINFWKITRYLLHLCELYDITRLGSLSLSNYFLLPLPDFIFCFRINWVMLSWRMVNKETQTKISRDCPGTIPRLSQGCPGIFLRFPGILFNNVFLFFHKKQATQRISTPSHSQDNPEELFMFVGFFCPPKLYVGLETKERKAAEQT